MGLPPSVVRFKKGNVEYISNVDQANYTMRELTRAALRDVGKYVTRLINDKALKLYGGGLAKTNRIIPHKGSDRTKLSFGYWARKKECDLQVGVKHDSWYGVDQEMGTDKMPKKSFIRNTVYDNIPKIVEIESKYLSALEDEAAALAMISEEEYEGSGEE
jgi:HK97 gp10 family phage protein